MLSRVVVRYLAAVTFIATLVLTTGPAWSSDADDYVQQAREFVAKGEVRSAVIQLKNALQSDPAHIEARLLLGGLHLRAGDGPAAAKEFARARDLDAAKERWLSGYARALILQGEFARLLDEIQVDPGLAAAQQAELHALRGNASLATRQVDAAREEYLAALQLDPANPLGRLGMAQLMLLEGREQEAVEQLDAVLMDYPDHVESRLGRADLLRRQQRLEDAAADYAAAARLSPDNARAHIGLALVHIARRDLAAANQQLDVLGRIGRGLPAVHYLQALVSFQTRDFARASDELQTLLRMVPSNLQAQLLYGIVSYARDEFTIADDYLTRVFASLPDNSQVVKLLGAARLKLKQPDRAVQVLAPAVNAETADAQLLALLGTAYIQAGDNSKGAEYIQRAVELDPDQALLRTQLAVGRIATGETAAAIAELESAVALGQDVIQADVLLVLSYLQKEQFEQAIAASEALEARMADSPIPYNLTGLALLAQRQFEPARARFRLALEKDPEFLVAQMNLARLAVVAGQPQDAVAAYQAVLAKDAGHLGALMGMAALARADKDSAAAERWLLRANSSNPDALPPILLLAEIYLRDNQGLKASNVLSGLDPQQAQLPQVLRLRGMAQLQSGEFASAMHTLGSLADARPDSIEAWFQLARAQVAAGDTRRARESFERAIALDESHQVPVVWVGLAELELREQQYTAALELARQVREHFPDSIYSYDIEAAAYRGLGRLDEALAASEAALAIERSQRRVHAYAGALVSAGQQSKAAAVLREWLGEQPTDGAAWATLGMLEQQMGHADAALEAYQQVLQHSEPQAVILNNMAWLYLERGDSRALELATKAYELAPTRAEIVDTYGWVLFRQGRLNEGLSALQQALIIAPRNAEIALHVAEALHEMRRDSEARPILQRIIREQPNSAFAASAQDLLDRLRG